MLSSCSKIAPQKDAYDYSASNREMIQYGVQAVLTCNGLFTSNRTLEQVYDQELKYLQQPVGNALGVDYKIDWDRKTVTIGISGSMPVMRAVFREGCGCIILAPDQTFDIIDDLPIQSLPPLSGDPSIIPWPDGDLLKKQKLPKYIDKEILAAASKWSFERESPHQVTLSLIMVHKGQIIHERYAEGVDMFTKTRTWSTAKSIAVTLMGILVDQGKMDLDAPLGIEWLPAQRTSENDPRAEITLRNVLNMSSGLYTVDNRGWNMSQGQGSPIGQEQAQLTGRGTEG